jgi:hypothetical protein
MIVIEIVIAENAPRATITSPGSIRQGPAEAA